MSKKKEYIRISVVTPNFNGERFLEKTLLSVLSQNYPNLEYIVVDGKSTDSSMKIVEKYAGKLAHVITEPDRGHADAVNKGFARASGDAMAWINSDDLLAPGSLALVNEVFQDFSDVEWVTGRVASILENDALNILRDVRPWSWLRFLCGDFRHIQQEGTFWRRSLWVRAGGGLSLNYSLANDFELWARFFLYAPLYSVDAVTGYFRHRDGQRSVTHRQQYDGESEQVLTELLNAIPISLLARYLDVLSAKRILYPSHDFKAIPARLAVVDPPVIRVDQTTRRMVRETFLPSFPTADKPDETLHDLAFNGADCISWTGGPDFTSGDLTGLDVELVQSSSPARHGVEFSDSTPPMPLLIGPLAVYELGPLQYRIQLSYTGKAIGHDIVFDKPTPNIRLRLVLTAERYAVIVNGRISAVGPVAGEQIPQRQHAVFGGGYLSRYWAGTIKRIWVAFKSRTGGEISRLIAHDAAGGAFRHDLFERMRDRGEQHSSSPLRRGMKIIAFDALWQEPARTEKHAFDLIRRAAPSIPGSVYLAFPWATLIDATERKMPQAKMLEEELDRLLSADAGGRAPVVVSVCQHIKYRKYLSMFRRAGVTDLYCSHAETGSHLEQGIRIWPFQLFPTQCPGAVNDATEDADRLVQDFLARDIDFSYVGAYDPRYYLTNTRQIIAERLASTPGAYIKNRSEWHYERQVYTQQVYGKKLGKDEIEDQTRREIEYREVMIQTKFALCPSGTGPNSIRFWEALEFGCIPILLSDKMALPGDEAEWQAAVLRVPEESQAIEQIPELIQGVLADKDQLSSRLAALRRLHTRYSVENMVQHLLEATRVQASAMLRLRTVVARPLVFIDGRRQPAQALARLVEKVRAWLQQVGVSARVITWDTAGVARDETGVEISSGCEPLSLMDTSRPFGLIFNPRNLTAHLARGLPQLLLQPVTELPVEAYDEPADPAARLRALYGDFDVTLISSIFKGRRFLPAFLESISAYTCKSVIEHLMIVAASPEDELSFIAERQHADGPNISLIYLPKDPGLYEVWNQGLSLASGRYVGNANLDDFRAPRQIELLVDLLEKTPEADVASAAIAVATEPTGDWSKVKDLPVWYANIKNGAYEGKDLFRIDGTGKVVAHNIPHCLPLWRRSLHHLFGYFDERQFGPSADWEFWLRCGGAGVRFAHLNEVLGIYYKNENTYWRRNPDTQRLEQNVIRRHFNGGKLLNRFDGSLSKGDQYA